MSIVEFEEISMTLGIGGLIVLMAWIVWDVAKQSDAGKYGTFVLYGALGLGVVGFLIKQVVTVVLDI
ncbi:MAG: DUF2788 domain-containing protein [Gammaproteobacteria bacterium]